MQALSEALIKRRSKHFDLGCVTLLDLSRAGTVLGVSLRVTMAHAYRAERDHWLVELLGALCQCHRAQSRPQ